MCYIMNVSKIFLMESSLSGFCVYFLRVQIIWSIKNLYRMPNTVVSQMISP